MPWVGKTRFLGDKGADDRMKEGASFAEFACSIRRHVLTMVHQARASHVGGALSVTDLLAVLYGVGGTLQVFPDSPHHPQRDRLIFSKGHACSALYAALALRGFFPVAELATFGQDGGRLMTHANHKIPGVEFSTGSLGHGLPVACGLALGAKRQGQAWKTVAILSDGDINEGSTWEAFLFGAQHSLDNLWVFIDANGQQAMGEVGSILGTEPLPAKLEAFGWNVRDVDGHSYQQMLDSFATMRPGKPQAIIARTVKGKGVDFMENRLEWHYRSPNADELKRALACLEKEF